MHLTIRDGKSRINMLGRHRPEAVHGVKAGNRDQELDKMLLWNLAGGDLASGLG